MKSNTGYTLLVIVGIVAVLGLGLGFYEDFLRTPATAMVGGQEETRPEVYPAVVRAGKTPGWTLSPGTLPVSPPPPPAVWEKSTSGGVEIWAWGPCRVADKGETLEVSGEANGTEYTLTIPQHGGAVSRNWELRHGPDYLYIQCAVAFETLPLNVRRKFRNYYVSTAPVSIHVPFPEGRGY